MVRQIKRFVIHLRNIFFNYLVPLSESFFLIYYLTIFIIFPDYF